MDHRFTVRDRITLTLTNSVCYAQVVNQPNQTVRAHVLDVVDAQYMSEALGQDLAAPIKWLSTTSKECRRWMKSGNVVLPSDKSSLHMILLVMRHF